MRAVGPKVCISRVLPTLLVIATIVGIVFATVELTPSGLVSVVSFGLSSLVIYPLMFCLESK